MDCNSEEHITSRSTVVATCENAGPHSGDRKIHGKHVLASQVGSSGG
jgi:hypothetical protein